MDINLSTNPSIYAIKAGQVNTSSSDTASTSTVPSDVLGAVTEPTPRTAELEKAVKDIQEHIALSHRNLEFSIDDTTHQVVVKVVATDTGELVRQLPSETALKMAQRLSEGDSLLLDTRV